MIAVLADDLSGAAELAGVALRHGLTAQVQTDFQATGADVICLDTDSRMLSANDAAARVAGQARKVIAAGPAWLFKKCDSVLRGPVLAEARAVAAAAGFARLLVLPTNPSRGRVIRDGHYFVGEQTLHETAFARDPLHPRATSRVADLLGGSLDGISVPDVQTDAEMRRYAETLKPDTLPVGAADFFRALLEARVPRRPGRAKTAAGVGPTLVVCGSAAAWAQRRAEADAHAIPAFPLPHELTAIARTLPAAGRTLLGIGDGPVTQGQSPEALAARLADTVAALVRTVPVGRLLLEGGATAASVLRTLGWNRLEAVPCAGDVAGLQPAGPAAPQVFIKPGSYAWPESLWPPG